jgi:hypothetical protein
LTLLTTESWCPKDLEPLAWDDGISRTICANQENGGGETKKMHFSNSHLHEGLANLVIYSFFCPTHAAFFVFLFSLLCPEWLEYEYE